MGGEVSLHRTLVAAGRSTVVLTRTPAPYTVDGIRVEPIATDDVLNVNANPAPIVTQLHQVGARAVLAQNELSLPAVKAARALRIPSIVSVHTPPRFGSTTRHAIPLADAAIYNTATSAAQWGEPDALVLHPPISDLPAKPTALPRGDAYTLLSSLRNKGVEVVLELAARMPSQRFIIVRSPAEATHGLPDIVERVAALPNVELAPRVAPDEVARTYLSQTRILLAPSRYETYGMSAIEAAGHGIPAVHVDTPHVREGIGDAAVLVAPLDVTATAAGIATLEADYTAWSQGARLRAEEIAARQTGELAAWREWLGSVRRLTHEQRAQRQRVVRVRGRR